MTRELPPYLTDCIDMSSPYAEKYIQLTCSSERTGHTEHHIVPVYFFKRVLKVKEVRRAATRKRKCSIDMESVNIARITDAKHVVAHYYLHKCSSPLLQRSADRAFMAMFNHPTSKNITTWDLLNGTEYAHLYDEMLHEFNVMLEKYGENFIKFHGRQKVYDEFHLVNESEFPKISYYLVQKNPRRNREKYSARVMQNGKENCVYLYRSEALSKIWVDRVKCIYEIALDHYLETGTVPEAIMENIVTVDNLRSIYTKFLPVPFGGTLPKITYSITKPNKARGGYFLTITEDGVRTRRTLNTDSIIIARRMIDRMKRAYDEAVSLESSGIPVPDELRQMIVRKDSGRIEDFRKPGNIGLVNFLAGTHIEDKKYAVFSKKSKKILHVVDEWEKSMMDSGLKDRTIYQCTRVARKYLDNSLTIDLISEDMLKGIVNEIRNSTNNWYNNVKRLHLFIKFAAGRYSLPASLVDACYVRKPSATKVAA